MTDECVCNRVVCTYDPDFGCGFAPSPQEQKLRPRFIIRSSYGNDSIALIQWAFEQELEGVVVVYSDTGWARKWWETERVPHAEQWVRSLGFIPVQVKSVGMEAIVKQHKGWPFRLGQFCTDELKIAPMQAWLAAHDPDKRAVILTGVRREESENRKSAPHYRLKSPNDGDRCMVSPLLEFTESRRDELITRAGFVPLAHRSEECRCINAGKEDIKRFDEDDVTAIERIESEAGYTSKGKPRVMYRPNKHLGATGIRQIMEWARSARGKYVAPTPMDPDDDIAEQDTVACQKEGWCG